MEALLTEHDQCDVEKLLAPAGGGQAGGMGPGGHQLSVRREGTWQETDRRAWNPCLVRPPKQTPAMTARRPPEPFRPLPSRKLGVTLLSVQARRRRFTNSLPPRAGESGGW